MRPIPLCLLAFAFAASAPAATASAWVSPQAGVAVSADGPFVRATAAAGGPELELRLDAPQALEGSHGVLGGWIFVRTDGAPSPLTVRFLVRDAAGREYRLYASGAAPLSGRWEYVRSFPVEARQGDLVAPACAVTDARPPVRPAFPLSLVGLRIAATQGSVREAEVQGVRLVGLDFAKSSCYWLLADRTHYGAPTSATAVLPYRCVSAEESGIATPFLLPADLASGEGRYEAAWRLRDAATGKTVGAGGFAFQGGGGPAAAFRPLPLPAPGPGNYLLDVRVGAADQPAAKPAELSAWLIVFNGAAPAPADPPPTRLAWRVAIAPENPSGVFDSRRLALPVAVSLAGLGKEAAAYRLETTATYYDGRPLRKLSSALEPAGDGAGRVRLELDIPDDESVVNVECVLKDGDAVVDRASRLVGVRGIAPAAPAAVADAAATTARSVEPFYLGITAMGPKFRDDALYHRNLQTLRDAGIGGIEFSVEWAYLEPLPGCWTFAELDRQLAYAAGLGFKVSLRMRNEFPRYTVPDWVTADVLRQQDGEADDVVASAPVFSPLDRRWVDASLGFLRTVAGRYAAFPAVDSAKLSQNIREAYWVDRPFRGEYTDYSPAAAAAFREWLKAKYGDVARAAAAHGAAYAGWDDVALPQPYESVPGAEPDLSPRWRDFMAFKADAYNRHLLETAAAIHDVAPRLRSFVYSMNWLTGPPTPETLASFQALNGAGALGAAHAVGEIYYARLYCPAYGLQIRLEPNAYAIHSEAMIDDHAGEMLEGAGGGRPTFFSYWPNRPGGWFPADQGPRILARIAAWDAAVRRLPPLSLPRADVGIAFSWTAMAAVQRGWEANAFTPDARAAAEALKGEGIEAFGADDFFTPELLRRFKVIVLPAASATVIPAPMAERLRGYVEEGGCLVLERRSGERIADGAGSLAERLGLPAVLASAAPRSVGAGRVVRLPDGTALDGYLRSPGFLALYASLGGARRTIPLSPGLVATLHQGDDGRLFLYLLNAGREPSVRFRLQELSGKAAELDDLLNGGAPKAVPFETGSADVEIPLPPQRAALLELKGLRLTPATETP